MTVYVVHWQEVPIMTVYVVRWQEVPTVEWMKLQREMLMTGVMPTKMYVCSVLIHFKHFDHYIEFFWSCIDLAWARVLKLAADVVRVTGRRNQKHVQCVMSMMKFVVQRHCISGRFRVVDVHCTRLLPALYDVPFMPPAWILASWIFVVVILSWGSAGSSVVQWTGAFSGNYTQCVT